MCYLGSNYNVLVVYVDSCIQVFIKQSFPTYFMLTPLNYLITLFDEGLKQIQLYVNKTAFQIIIFYLNRSLLFDAG